MLSSRVDIYGMEVRPWSDADAGVLRSYVYDLLKINEEVGGRFLPTERNAAILVQLGLRWAAQGEPTLVACAAGGLIVGFVLWGDLSTPMDLDVRGKACTGVGTYVIPEFRRFGIASALRMEAMKIAATRGYDYVAGSVIHPAATTSALSVGFLPAGVIVECPL